MSTTSTAVAGQARVPAAAIFAQAAMELRLLLRAAESLVITFGIPLGILVFFSTIEVLPTGDHAAVDFLVPGVLAISIGATGLVAVAIQTAFERKYGVLKRLGATPLTAGKFLVAKALAVVALVAAQTALTLAVAGVVLGWRPTLGITTLAATLLALVLGVMACTSLGLLLAGTLRAEATLAFSNALFLVLLMISGVAFDAELLPDALAALGRWSPIGALGEALRSALTDGHFAGPAIIALAVWSVVAIVAGRRWFRWEPQ